LETLTFKSIFSYFVGITQFLPAMWSDSLSRRFFLDVSKPHTI